jgi:hypothetical protein
VGRRRRRTRRERSEEPRERVAPEVRHAAKAEQKRLAAFEESRRRLDRRRNVIGALGFIPLAAVFLGVPFGPLDAFGISPRDGWLLVWAILFGSFIGLTIRLVLERRRFQRAA